jgi:subtilisin family serine protease
MNFPHGHAEHRRRGQVRQANCARNTIYSRERHNPTRAGEAIPPLGDPTDKRAARAPVCSGCGAPGCAGSAATELGTLVVAAAGNDGTDNGTYPTYPANYGHGKLAVPGLALLTVAATGRDDWKTGFSNDSPGLVDIAAPGKDILTTGAYWIGPARYPSYSGTSAATAFVSSAAALVLARNPGWGPAETIRHLKDSADKLDSLRLVCDDGNRLNIRRAVEGPLTLQAPAAGAIVHKGKTTAIKWANAYKSVQLDHVKIEFSPDDGATWTTLAASTANDGKWNWKPGQTTAEGRIRVTPVAGNFPKVSGTFRVV